MDDFSDDGFDDLNDTIFQELENNAIQATQAASTGNGTQQTATATIGQNFVDLTQDDGMVDEGEYYDGGPGTTPTNNSGFARPALPARVARTAEASGSSRIVPVHGHPEPSAYPQYRQTGVGSTQRYAPPYPAYTRNAYAQQQLPARQQTPIGTQFTRPTHLASQTQHSRPPSRASVAPEDRFLQPNTVIDTLKKQICALEGELNAARGEISIVRAKQKKTIQDHHQELQRIKNHYTDQLRSQEDAAKQAQYAQQLATTELEFARRDLREDFSRARRKDATPKKTARTFGIGDGFDNTELAPSPTKSQGRARNTGSVALPIAQAERTPSKAKRKRPTADSPMRPLEVHTVEDVVMSETSQTFTPHIDLPNPNTNPVNPLSHKFVRVLLDHHRLNGPMGTLDTMSKYHFPSDPDIALANKYLHRIPDMGIPAEPTSLLSDFASFTLELWNQCLGERYYDPIADLLSLIVFTIQLDIQIVGVILPGFLEVAQTTCLLSLNAFRDTKVGATATESFNREILDHINVSNVVSAMYLAALSCASAPLNSEIMPNTALQAFWSGIDPGFILKGLLYEQPRETYESILRLLETSALEGSLGPIEKSGSPTRMADALIDKLTHNLRATPPWVGDSRTSYYRHLGNILRPLSAFATSRFGLARLTACTRVLPRLATVMCNVLEEIYEGDAGLHLISQECMSSEQDAQNDSIPSVYEIFARLMLLLHTIITNPKADVLANLRPYMENLPGTWERYILTLARLEFAEEDLVLERGIDSKTLDLGHELLDLVVTPNPELGDQIVALFGDVESS